MSCQSRCSFSLPPRPRAGWRSQTSHKDYAMPNSIWFSNETSMSPCMGRSIPFQIQHSSGCLFPWLPVPSWCTARSADKPLQPSWHGCRAAGDAMNSGHATRARLLAQDRHTLLKVYVHVQVSRGQHTHMHPPAIWK